MLGYVWLFFCLVLFMFVHCFQFYRGTLWSNLATNSNKFIQQCCMHQSSIQKPQKTHYKMEKTNEKIYEVAWRHWTTISPRISKNINHTEKRWNRLNHQLCRGQNWGLWDLWGTSLPIIVSKIQQKTKRPTSYHYKIRKYQEPQVCRGPELGPMRYHFAWLDHQNH